MNHETANNSRHSWLFGVAVLYRRNGCGGGYAPDDVRKAIDGGRYLKNRTVVPTGLGRATRGRLPGWNHRPLHVALLNAGVRSGGPHVKKALDYLRGLRPKTTYVVSLQTMVLCRAKPVSTTRPHRPERPMAGRQPDQGRPGQAQGRLGVRTGSNGLAATVRTANSPAGPLRGRPRGGSLPSRSASRSPARLGNVPKILAVQPETIRTAAGPTTSDHGRTGSMTCAGIASLVIANDVLHEPDAKVSGDQIDPCYRASVGRPGPDRAGHRLAGGRTSPSAIHREPASAPSGITIISTGWSSPDDSRRGARSARTIGIARGPPSVPEPQHLVPRVLARRRDYAKDREDWPPAWP